jgi:hypothetical protein
MFKDYKIPFRSSILMQLKCFDSKLVAAPFFKQSIHFERLVINVDRFHKPRKNSFLKMAIILLRIV